MKQNRYRLWLSGCILIFVVLGLGLSAGRGIKAESEDKPVTKKILPADISQEELIRMVPALIDNRNLKINGIKELHFTGTPQEINLDQYFLTIDGLVEHPLRLTYKEILSYPSITKVVLLICPGFFADNAEWTGVPVREILQLAKAKESAKEAVFYGADGYSQSLDLEEAMWPGVFLAYKVNGETLPREHGFPLRLVAEGIYGGKWVKWVNRIEVR